MQRLVIGITGASGASLALELLHQLKDYTHVEGHVVISAAAEMTLLHECDVSISEIKLLCSKLYNYLEIGASIASGSFQTMGMVVLPCSMNSLAHLVHGIADTLLIRACDVTIKERRPLILVPREAPLSKIHLRNLLLASELGAIILPPVPAYYQKPQTITDLNQQITKKILALLGISPLQQEWQGL